MNLHIPVTRRRSAVLILTGTAFFWYGLAIATSGFSSLTREALYFADLFGDLHYWGWVWMASGVGGIAVSRQPIGRDKWGFAGMASMAALWASFYAIGWMTWALGGWLGFEHGTVHAWNGFVSWLTVSILLLIVSGWPEAEQ